ncbi:hypothetical protein [Flavobacterium cerinum]|uniref:Uncharacterized protein n=1 Tax=Flavobacterium cerinum TaxID=2502784 RepID=A0A3S3Q2W0_9FLAO|nr:hypothetical protein [Flavobacterium cerinum]RWW91843.1 hypothetical protein EPI11_17530 [Flavobacterium cerinum]
MSYRSNFYILNDLSAKLLKKSIDKRRSTGKFNVSLKYYEAYALYLFIGVSLDYTKDEQRRVTREILSQLDQKLT